MKDIVISGKAVKREFIVALSCFAAAFIINVAAVIMYVRPWVEIFTQIGYVFVTAVVIYVLLLVFRVLYQIIRILIKK